MRYSVQPRDRIFVRAYGFLSFAKNIVVNKVVNTVKSFLIMLMNLLQMQLKLL